LRPRPARNDADRDPRYAPAAPRHTADHRRPTLDRKTPPQSQQTRRERRAAENRERFDAAREERRNRAAARGSGGRSGGPSIGLITVAALAIGAVIIGGLAFTQLGGDDIDDLVAPSINYPAGLIDGAAIGSADAPVTMEVFEDFQCSVCATHALTVEPVLVARYVNDGTLRIVHRDMAFLGNGGQNDESVLAASAASCAMEQDEYFPMAHWIYENQDGVNRGGFRRERLDAIATAVGLDMAAFGTCMDNPAGADEVRANTNEIRGLGVNSTPTVRLNGGQLIVGLQTADALGAAIEAAAAAAASSPAP
jgi:protein-disulfide isomerase